jgi:putative heme-binding domain-containing protein
MTCPPWFRSFCVALLSGAVLIAWMTGLRGAEPEKTASAFDPAPVVSLFELLIGDENNDPATTRQCLEILASKIENRELSAAQVETIKPRLDGPLSKIIANPAHPLYRDAVLLATAWKNPLAMQKVRALLSSAKEPAADRVLALEALLAAGDKEAFRSAAAILADPQTNPAKFRAEVLAALGRTEEPRVAEVVLSIYSKVEPDQQPRMIELLTQRVAWSKALLEAIGQNKIPAAALNVNQVAKLQASRDPELIKLVTAKWGVVRTARNPQREQVVAEMKTFVRKTPGNAEAGQLVFRRLCAQCHKIYGEGNDVGPDLTSNGRNDFNQLLSNVFDPSLVIGAAYQARLVRTTDGRVLSGIPSEDNEQRVVLKIQGGKQEVIARDDIESMRTSELSLMPEGLEKQLKPAEIADLFAFLILNKPPSDPAAKQLPGVYEPRPGKK